MSVVRDVGTIRALALIPLVRLFAGQGGDADAMLAKHGILRAQLDAPYSLIPIARYVGFFEDAALTLNDPSLGMRAGSTMAPADLGPLGLLFSAAPTLASAFGRLTQYLDSLQSATQSGLRDQQDVLVWSYRIEDKAIWPRVQDAEYTMATVCQMIRSIAGRGWSPLEVHFEHEETRGGTALERYFKAPILFAQPANRFVMARADVRRPIQVENRQLTHLLEHHIGDLLIEWPDQASLKARAMRLIGLYLGREKITVARLSKDLGLSPRSFQRRLEGEGTSLRLLLRDHRRSLAELRMGARRLSNGEIADLLGYADGTVFWRAFKGWTGLSPRVFQQTRRKVPTG